MDPTVTTRVATPAEEVVRAPHPLELPDSAMVDADAARLVALVSPAKLDTMIKAGHFPRPFRLPGSHVRRWRVRQLRAWVEQQFPGEAV